MIRRGGSDEAGRVRISGVVMQGLPDLVGEGHLFDLYLTLKNELWFFSRRHAMCAHPKLVR